MQPRIAALVLLASAAAWSMGCGGSSDSTATATAVDSQQVASAQGEIAVAGWQYYQVPQVQDSGGVKSRWSYLSSGPDIFSKARSGDFDVVSVASEAMSGLDALGVLLPIDAHLLPNYKQITPKLRDDPAWKSSDGEVFAIPFSVTPSLTAFDTSRVSVTNRIDDLLKAEFRDGIALYDDPATIGQIAMAQGLDDTQEMTEADLDRAMQLLEELKPNVKTFFLSGEEVQLFNSGSIVVCVGTFGTILAKAIEQNPAIKFNFLAGGSFVNAWAITSDDNLPASLSWIDGTLTPRGQRAIIEASGDYPAVPAAAPALRGLGDPVSEAVGALDLDQLLEREPIFKGYAAEPHGDVVGIEEVTRAWNEYKASF
jgi:spermidine/putrescine-binding protein